MQAIISGIHCKVSLCNEGTCKVDQRELFFPTDHFQIISIESFRSILKNSVLLMLGFFSSFFSPVFRLKHNCTVQCMSIEVLITFYMNICRWCNSWLWLEEQLFMKTPFTQGVLVVCRIHKCTCRHW